MPDRGALTGQSTRKVLVGCSLLPATADRLAELAAESGMTRSTLCALLLEEIVPTITSVRKRLQVTRASANGTHGDG